MEKKIDLVVLGAGYGGLTAALRLSALVRRRPEVVVHLVDRNPYHTLKTRLHEAAVGRADVSIAIERFLTRRNIRFHLGEVKTIDLAARTLQVGDEAVPFDHLVLALGCEANYYGIPGLSERSFPLQSASDADRILDHVHRVCAEAAGQSDPVKRQALLRFLVGGGGLSGVEFAGEMVEHAPERARAFGVDPSEIEVAVIEGGPRLVPAMGEEFSAAVASKLQSRGVKILTDVRLVRYDDEGAALSDGRVLPTRTVVWTGGIKITALLKASGLATGAMGRIQVDGSLQATGHPNVWAIGDNALATDPTTGKPVPTAAQFALQQGRIVAENVVRTLDGNPLRSYHPKVLGEVVSLGRHLAVGWMALPWAGRLKFAGFVASLLKAAVAERHLVFLWREARGVMW